MLQTYLSKSLLLTRLARKDVKIICGVDVGYKNENACAYAVEFQVAGMKLLDSATAKGIPPLPYLPGYLFMREAPLMIEALSQLKSVPDLILADGHGIAHPRGMGLASVIGLLLGIPTLGVAKSLLTGEVKSAAGRFHPILINGRHVGYRLMEDSRPFYISPGNLVNVRSIPSVMKIFDNRYPYPLTCADRLSRRCVRED
jgi:deoxyribonuclease V